MDLALEEVELELGDDVDLFVSTSNDNKTHNNNDSDNWPLRQDREDARSRGTDYRMPLNASGCRGMHLNASQCLSMPLNASQCMAYMSKMRQIRSPSVSSSSWTSENATGGTGGGKGALRFLQMHGYGLDGA